MIFFHPQANIEHVIQRVFTHDLLQGKIISSCFPECDGLAGDLIPVFENIIHALPKPSFFIARQGNVNLLGARRFAGSLDK